MLILALETYLAEIRGLWSGLKGTFNAKKKQKHFHILSALTVYLCVWSLYSLTKCETKQLWDLLSDRVSPLG